MKIRDHLSQGFRYFAQCSDSMQGEEFLDSLGDC
jgi:hypothetical protein